MSRLSRSSRRHTRSSSSRADSQISLVEKPEMLEGETKAQYYWRLLKTCVVSATNVMKKADIKDLTIIHGIHHSRRINHVENITQVLYNRNSKDYLTLDGKFIRIFKPDGRKKDLISPEEPMNRLIHASQTQQYVGWSLDQDPIWLMNSDFEVISSSKAPGPILAAVYNNHINEIVTVGAGYLTTWVFRYGGRHLLPRRTVKEGLTLDQKFSHLVLEETPSRSQKGYAAWGTSIAVFNLYEGKLLSIQKDLHVRSITALLFFNPLKYLITAARDGSIKVWDDTWHLQLVFVGHCDIVNYMAVYPYGPMILSASNDCTIRLWSLETCDEIDCLETPDPVVNLKTLYSHTTVLSQCDQHADLWKVQQIHTLHCTIGHRVVAVKQTTHPSYPIRSVLLCKDASVRIITPPTGDILTTLLMDPRNKLIDAAYAIAEGTLFAVFDDGTIVKANSFTNPCTIVDVWKYPDIANHCNFLLVYEYVIEPELQGDMWGAIKRTVTTRSLKAAANAPKKHSNRTLLLGGRKDGYLCVYNWDSGEVDFEIEAHGNKGVLNMIANSQNDQLISAGYDNIIKVWRLYPFAQEALTPLMSFYCTHLPRHMTVMKRKLMVAFQDHPTATYSVVMYNLEDKNRHDHIPDDDHTDTITGLSVCSKMKLFASSSLDGTVRIWNEANIIVRILKLNATPHSVGFCSQRGDLVVGIGDHLHHIDYRTYMPKAYRTKMISMRFADTKAEKPKDYDMNKLNTMSNDDIKRLKAARSSFKFLHFNDILSEEESELVNQEKEEKDTIFSMLAAREAEIAKIRDGDMKARKKPKPSKLTKREAFDKYLQIFYNRPKLEMPKEDPHFEEGFTEMQHPVEEEEPEDIYEPEAEPVGFFPGPSKAKKVSLAATSEEQLDKPLQPGYTINASGFIPNSVLVKLLWPPDTRPKIKPQEPYRPPKLSDEQIRSLSAKKQGSNWQRSLVLDYDDEEEEKRSELFGEEEDERLSEPGEGLASPSKSSFLAKMQEVLEKPPSPKAEEEEVPPPPEVLTPGGTMVEVEPGASPVEGVAVGDESAVSGTKTTVVKKPSKPRAAPAPRKPIVKYISRPKPPSPPPPKVPTPVKVREKTPSPPPPPPTPLPGFITQFKGLEWFEEYFPNCNENTMPKPWTATAFVTMLLRVMRVGKYTVKVAVAEAIILIKQTEDDLTNGDAVCKCVQSVMNHHANPPSCLNEDEKLFIITGIRLMSLMGYFNKEYFAELLVQFLDGDKDVRKLVMSSLKTNGMKDPHDLLIKELDSWDVWNLEEESRHKELHKICDDWLEKWMTTFKLHLEDSIDRLKKGQGVHGRASKSQLGRKGGKSPASRDTTHTSQMEGVEFIPTPPRDGSRPVTVTFETAPDPSVLENVTYIEALTYFCEMELEKELERLRNPQGQKSAGIKNTVLVLPKIDRKPALVRLGETHTSQRRHHKEAMLSLEYRMPPVTTRGHQPQPGQLFGFPPCINLPLKTIYMNPFPSPIDLYDPHYREPVLIMLKSAQKYFIPSRSHVPTDSLVQ